MKKCFALTSLFSSMLLLLSCQAGVNERDFSIASTVLDSGIEPSVAAVNESDYVPPASPVVKPFSRAGNGCVLLSWKNPSDSDFYAVQVSCDTEDGDYEFPVLVKGLPDSEGAIVISGLKNETEYAFTLRSVDVNFNIEETGVELTLVPNEPEESLDPPSGVEILSVYNDDGVIVLEWKSLEETSVFYGELYADPAEGNLSQPFVFSPDQKEFRARGLTSGVSHQFTFVTYNASLGSTSVSTAATPLVLDTASPSDVSVRSEVKGGSVILTWKAGPENDVAFYEVYWNDESQKVLANSEDDFYSFSAGAFEDGETVTFTVRAVDASGNKSEGTETEVSIRESSAAALGLSAVTLPLADENAVQVSVSVSTLNDNVYLSRLVCSYGYFKSASKLLHGDSSLDITGDMTFTARKNGTYTISALDSYGNVAVCYVSVQGIDETPPEEVLVPSAFSGDSAVFLSWCAPSDEDFSSVLVFVKKGSPESDVHLEEESDSSKEPTVINAAPGEEMKFTETNLENGMPYTFTICTADRAGNVSKGTVLSSIVPEDADSDKMETEVEDLKATAGNRAATLTWTLPEENDIYAVRISVRAEGEEDFTYLATEAALWKSYSVRFLENGFSYEFLVQTVDSHLRITDGVVSEAVVPLQEADVTPPPSPVNFKGAAGENSVSLSWENPIEDDFVALVLTLTLEDGTAVAEQKLNRTAQSAVFAGLKSGTSYTATLASSDASGNWSQASFIKVVTLESSQSPQKSLN